MSEQRFLIHHTQGVALIERETPKRLYLGRMVEGWYIPSFVEKSFCTIAPSEQQALGYYHALLDLTERNTARRQALAVEMAAERDGLREAWGITVTERVW
jgi:hypothetical protein